MTLEEALKYADNNILANTSDMADFLETCKAALRRRLAETPIYEADGYANGELVYDTWYCPNCGKGYEVGFDDYDYCPCCGQRIDRSEVE